jgi:hypothetical protein
MKYIITDTIINFICNPSYTYDYKLTEIQNIYNIHKNNIMLAILSIFDIYNKNKEIIKKKKLYYFDEQIDFLHKIILSDFFDINKKFLIDDIYIYCIKIENPELFNLVLKNNKLDWMEVIYFLLYLLNKTEKDDRDDYYIKYLIRHPKLDINYNGLIDKIKDYSNRFNKPYIYRIALERKDIIK